MRSVGSSLRDVQPFPRTAHEPSQSEKSSELQLRMQFDIFGPVFGRVRA